MALNTQYFVSAWIAAALVAYFGCATVPPPTKLNVPVWLKKLPSL